MRFFGLIEIYFYVFYHSNNNMIKIFFCISMKRKILLWENYETGSAQNCL